MKSVLARITNDADRARFKNFYSLDAEGIYQSSEDQWQAEGDQILRILNAIDYVPRYGRSSFVDEARGLLEKLLSDQPIHAPAWNLYFANYYRFRFAGGPHEFDNFGYFPDEVAQIRKAAALCPDDTNLQLLLKLATSPGNQNRFGPDLVTLFDQWRKQGTLGNDYPSLKRNED